MTIDTLITIASIIAANVVTVICAAIKLDRRITRLEADIRWLLPTAIGIKYKTEK